MTNQSCTDADVVEPRFMLVRSTDAPTASAVFALRYLAYRAVDAIPENLRHEFSDEYDLQENVHSYLLYKGTSHVGSIRVCTTDKSSDQSSIPAMEVYADDIAREIGVGKRIVESNRFVIHPEYQKEIGRKQLYLFKAVNIHIMQFKADYLVTAVREDHAPFYKRMLAMTPISGPKQYPRLRVNMVLLAGDVKRDFLRVTSKTSELLPTPEELKTHAECGRIWL